MLISCASILSSLTPIYRAETDSIRAAFCGGRIISQQVSPESLQTFDLVIKLAKLCHGDWRKLSVQADVTNDSMERFLEYCSTVLENLGYYQVNSYPQHAGATSRQH
jgi:hypothetical protein